MGVRPTIFLATDPTDSRADGHRQFRGHGHRGEAGGAEFDLWLQKTGVDVVSLDRAHAEVARFAWRRFGKGRHQAGLNFGDCFAYALASLTGEPLLFKGDDFSHTDLTTV